MLDRIRRLPGSLAALYAGTIATRLGTFVVPYLAIYLTEARGLSMATTGRVVAAGGVGLLLGNVLGGQLADRVGRKTTLLLALTINVVGVAVLSLPLRSVPAYAVALGLALGGAGMYTPAANALIADSTSESERSVAYALNYVCVNVGMGLGPLLGGLLATSSYGLLFFGDIVTSIACAVILGLGVPKAPPSRVAAADDYATTLRVWAANPGLVAFCGASIFLVFPLMGLEYAVPLLVRTTFDEGLMFVGLVYSINATCILVLSLPIERAIEGRNEAAMMSIAAGLWTAGLMILAVGFSVGALLVCTAVWTLGEIIGSIVLPSYISRRVAASSKGRMLSLQDAVRSLSGIVGPIGLGLVWDGAGAEWVLVALVVSPMLGIIVYVSWWRRGLGQTSSRPSPVVVGR